MTSKQSYFTNPQLQQAKMYPTGFPLINLHICKIKTSMPIFNYNYSFYKDISFLCTDYFNKNS